MSETDRLMRARRDDVDAKAREWMSYLNSGETTEQGKAGFQAWLAESPDHKAAFQMLNELWMSLDRVPHIENALVDAPPVAANAAKRAAWRPVPLTAASVRIAATLIVGIAAIVALATLQVADRADQHHFATEVGEVRTLDLTDGSQLVLRADTAIVTLMSKEERNVTIERGGAYFDVSRDEGRPFVVSAGDVHVRVRGTAFDVLKGPSSVTVSVMHGRVTVSDFTHNKRTGSHSVELTGGQQVTVAADGTFGAVAEIDMQRVLGWHDGRFSYLNARLEDIIADVNRYRTEKIIIEDAALGDLRITTMFRADNVDQMLAGIEATESVAVERSSSSVTIRRRPQP
jgi:transmembrane sensor